MKKAKTFVHETPKRMGRPRTVSDNGDATAVTVRLPRTVLAQVDKWAAEKGVKRSDAIREMVTYAIAGRMINGARRRRRRNDDR